MAVKWINVTQNGCQINVTQNGCQMNNCYTKWLPNKCYIKWINLTKKDRIKAVILAGKCLELKQ